MNLENLTHNELLKLKEQIEIKLYSKNDFWNAVVDLKELDQKRDEIDKKFWDLKEQQPQIKRLTDLGFTLVIYSPDNVGFLNYEKKKIGEKFYGCSLNKVENKLSFLNYEKPTLEEINEIEKILNIKEEKNNEKTNTNNSNTNEPNNSNIRRR
jgi:hypothetical protein